MSSKFTPKISDGQNILGYCDEGSSFFSQQTPRARVSLFSVLTSRAKMFLASKLARPSVWLGAYHSHL